MPATDIIVGVLVFLGLINGMRAGVIARLFGWLGVVAGILALPIVLPRINALFLPDEPTQALLFNITVGAAVVIVVAIGGMLLGKVMRSGVRLTPLSLLDRAGGIVLSLAVIAIGVSSVLSAAAKLPSGVGEDVRRSTSYSVVESIPWLPIGLVDLIPPGTFDGFPNGESADET